MKLSKLVVATSLSLCSAGAFAAVQLDLSTGSAGFFNTPQTGLFSETFEFDLLTPVTLVGIVTSVVNGGQNIDFLQISLVLKDDYSASRNFMTFAKVSSDPFEAWTISTPLLPVGRYELGVYGLNSAAIGTYSGNIALSAVGAVPEPNSYALMLAGAGVIGFLALRRRTNG